MSKGRKNIAVVGCGYWGKNLVRVFHEMGMLSCACDSSDERLKEVVLKYTGVKTTKDIKDVLNNADIEGVVISSPAATHYSLVKDSLMHKKNVFVEKPLALNVEEGKELVKLAEDNGCVLMVGHILNYHPAIGAIRNLIKKGQLGRIQYIYSNRLNFGKIRREENILWSFAPHDISVILELLGQMPEDVSARGSYYLHPNIADVTVSQMRFKSGVNAHIFVSWLHPFKEQKLVIVGDRQMVVFDDVAPWDKKLIIYSHEVVWEDGVPAAKKADGVYVPLEQDEPLMAECRHFAGCVEKGKQPITNGVEGLRVLRILDALQRSLDDHGATVSMGDENTRNYFAHETAVIDEDAQIGAKTKIWHFSHIMNNSRIGERCNIGQNVVISPQVEIGDNVKIQNNVSVYTGVRIEDDVFLGPSMVFTNVCNPRGFIERKDEYHSTFVKRGASIGANATVICGNTVGEYSFVGAGAVVTKDVPPYALIYGNPAVIHGWVCRCGWRLPVEQGFIGSTVCEKCRAEYDINNGGVKMIREGSYASTSSGS